MRSEIYCRNCLSTNVVISSRGTYAPFFVLRVFGEESIESLGEAISRRISSINSGYKKYLANFLYSLIKALPKSKKLLDFRSERTVKIRACKDCRFVGPNNSYSFGQLSGLYTDYRSDSYNFDRCSVEPDYAKIKDLVGKTKEEIGSRLTNVDRLIDTFVDINIIESVLDWGGGEGRFIPTKLINKIVTILDVSEEPLINPAYHRVNNLSKNSKFDYMQICHVLEHVSEPFSLMNEALSYINTGAIVYIEVPQDRIDADLNQFLDESSKSRHTLHEHINLYSVKSLQMLGNALGLKELHVGINQLDCGWCKAAVVSGIFVKET